MTLVIYAYSTVITILYHIPSQKLHSTIRGNLSLRLSDSVTLAIYACPLLCIQSRSVLCSPLTLHSPYIQVSQLELNTPVQHGITLSTLSMYTKYSLTYPQGSNSATTKSKQEVCTGCKE